MKKIVSLFMSVLLLLSCSVIVGVASEINEYSDNVDTLKSIFSEHGFNVDWINYLGEVKDNCQLYYAGQEYFYNMNYDVVVGDYIFHTTSQYDPYDIGLYLMINDVLCTLDDAYKNSYICDDDIDIIYGIVNSKANGHIRFNWIMECTDDIKTQFLQYMLNNDHLLFDLKFYKLGEISEYTLCYGGVFNCNNIYEITLGAYTFSGNEYYNTPTIPFYLVNNNEVINIEFAYNQQKIDSEVDMYYIYKLVTEGKYKEFFNNEDVKIEITGHKIQTVPKKIPTCKELGYDEYVYCTECQKVIVPKIIINYTGHTKITIHNKKATYFVKGYRNKKVCTVCGETIEKGKAIKKLKLKTPTVKRLTGGKQKITVRYSKVKDATGYQIKYKIGKKAVTKTYNKKTITTKFLSVKKKGTYKVYVRAFVKQGKYKAYSLWTKAKKVKVK